jgi:putative nucleotidyltransferase with HDIG domain
MSGPEPVPPRLVVRTLVASSLTIIVVLAAVFVAITWDTRQRVTVLLAENLAASQRAFVAFERRRVREASLQAATLADSPTLKAALDTYQSERRTSGSQNAAELLRTVQLEVEKLAARFGVDALVVVDPNGRLLASAGQRAGEWPAGDAIRAGDVVAGGDESIVRRGATVYRVFDVPIALGEDVVADLYVATALDDKHAVELAELSNAQIAIVIGSRVVGSSLSHDVRQAIASGAAALPGVGVVTLINGPYAVRRVFTVGDAKFYAVDSVGAALSAATRRAFVTLLWIASGALVLAGIASLRLAQSVARPIDDLSRRLDRMAEARRFDQPLPVSGTSRELDTLARTFNSLMTSLAQAEDATEQAYVGAIKALAVALDARDTYTAGHSARVSALSVMTGRMLDVPEADIEVLRLGALLHDIGKIGISDHVLTKTGPLTSEEFELVKEHTTVGAHILRQVPYLAAHVPLVELHHERPDGRGYPHGLRNDETPRLARIVHVADAFDAMTSARAYRPAQPVQDAIAELWRHAGTQFDAAVVEAFVSAWSVSGVTVLHDASPDADAHAPGASMLRAVGGGAA